ncbi:MAG: transglycosylase domain-containing protein, partial [Hyphococcus sp.]
MSEDNHEPQTPPEGGGETAPRRSAAISRALGAARARAAAIAGAAASAVSGLFRRGAGTKSKASANAATQHGAPSPYTEETKYTPAPALDGRALIGSFLGAGVSLAFIGAGALLATAFIVMAPRIPDDADLWNVNRQSAIIVLDRNGEEIAARGARYGEHVEPEELPAHLIKAFLSTEDRRFYDHAGVDLRGTLRAALANARAGAVTEGGSTITQQLARNLFLSAEQTYERKIREALLALWLEGHYTKNQILSLYLNRIYLGAGAYGVESAAQTYFGKSAREASLAEAAMLAGLPKAPSTYAPTQNPEGALRRAR